LNTSIELRLEDAGTLAAKGTVTFVSPSVDPRTGIALVRVALPADSSLWLGQLVHARILREEHAGCLAVPLTSVCTDHDGRSTLAVVEGDTAIRREVRVGLREGDLVEVSGGGLKAGDRVVTVGSYALPEKTKGEDRQPGAAGVRRRVVAMSGRSAVGAFALRHRLAIAFIAAALCVTGI
jgi:membrane fusion protein (multidrug efflux system)